MTRPDTRDCLTPVAFALFAALGIVTVTVLIASEVRPRDHRDDVLVGAGRVAPRGTFARIAEAGEWITNPDGSRVCRLRLPIVRGMTFMRNLCEDWQSPVPEIGQTVAWFRCDGGCRILVEGRWRP